MNKPEWMPDYPCDMGCVGCIGMPNPKCWAIIYYNGQIIAQKKLIEHLEDVEYNRKLDRYYLDKMSRQIDGKDNNPVTPKLKICSGCKKEYPETAEYFYKGKRYHNGLQAECKECFKATAKRNTLQRKIRTMELEVDSGN